MYDKNLSCFAQETLTDSVHCAANAVSDPLWAGLLWLLIGVGVFFTVGTGFVQLRLFRQSMREISGSRQNPNDPHGITSFQAFVTGLASRVGTGNIDFTGAVAVQGSVQAGFVVKATGDIEVGGIVSGAEVEGNNILIKGGIQGMNRGFVKAKGMLMAFFAENAEIEAGHNVTIADVVLNSQVRAGKKVTVLGRRGQIMGGSTFAGEEIEATQIGNPANVATKLEVGVNPMVQRQYKAVCQEYGDTKKKLDEIKKTLATLGKVDISKLPPERQEMVAQLGKVRFQVEGQLERLLEEMDGLEEKIQSMKRGRIRAADTIYPGVKLKINNVIKNIHSEEKRCTLSVEGDQIRTGAY